jgi:hypothetical protein
MGLGHAGVWPFDFNTEQRTELSFFFYLSTPFSFTIYLAFCSLQYQCICSGNYYRLAQAIKTA